MSQAPIDPAQFPVPTVKTHLLEHLAAKLREDGAALAETGHDITGSWAGLSACYAAPEADTLFSVLDPVAADGDEVETALSDAAAALESFAERAREIRGRWLTLKADASSFLASIDGDDDWRKADGVSRLWGGQSEKVAENDDLLRRAADLEHEYQEAERDCANAITALFGGTTFVSRSADGTGRAGAGEFAHGFDEPLYEVPRDWGEPRDTDHAWHVDALASVWDMAAGAAVDAAGMSGLYYDGQWAVPAVGLGALPWLNPQGVANARNYTQDTLVGLAHLTGFYRGEGPEPVPAERGLFTLSYVWEWPGWHMPEDVDAWKANAGPAWTAGAAWTCSAVIRRGRRAPRGRSRARAGAS